MDILRARRLELMKPPIIKSSTRYPNLWLQHPNGCPDDVELRNKPNKTRSESDLVSATTEQRKQCSKLSSKNRPLSMCIPGSYVGSNMVRRDLQRIGKSLEQLKVNVKEEHDEISRDFEERLKHTNISICSSISDIRKRIDALTSLIDDASQTRDSGIGENHSDHSEDTSIFSFDKLSPTATSPTSNFYQFSEEKQSPNSVVSLHSSTPLQIPKSPFHIELSPILRVQSVSDVNNSSSSNASSNEDIVTVIDKRSPRAVSVDNLSHPVPTTAGTGSPRTISVGAFNQTADQLSMECADSELLTNLRSYDSGIETEPLPTKHKAPKYYSSQRSANILSQYKYRNSKDNFGSNFNSFKSGASLIWPKDHVNKSLETSVPFNSQNIVKIRSSKPTPASNYLQLLRKAYCNWVPEKPFDDHENVAFGTALDWRSHNRFSISDYNENANYKIDPPTRYPECVINPSFYKHVNTSGVIEHSDKHKDLLQTSEVYPSERGICSETELQSKHVRPSEDRRWAISRMLWEGWTLPGFSEEVERQLIITMNANCSFREELIQTHNALRTLHNSQQLTEVDDLSRDSQMWADIIAEKGFMQYSELPGRGENIAFVDINGKEASGSDVTQTWYDEKCLFDFGEPKWRKATMNFTQLIWRASSDIGVGVSKVKGKDKCVIVAQYRPMGNGNKPGEFRKNVLPPNDS